MFYLKYDMYRNSWPLLALATYRQLLEPRAAAKNGQVNGACRNLPKRKSLKRRTQREAFRRSADRDG